MGNETDKRGRIMAAAACLFAKQGYKKTAIDDIVASAGVSKGLFYHYFRNKKELYLHLYDSYVAVLSRSIRERVDLTERDFFTRMRQVAHLRIEFITRYPGLWRFLYAAYTEQHPDVAPYIQQKNQALLHESYRGTAANIDWSKLKTGISPDKAIEMVTWVAEGFVRRVETEGMGEETYRQFDEYLAYLQTGMYERREV